MTTQNLDTLLAHFVSSLRKEGFDTDYIADGFEFTIKLIPLIYKDLPSTPMALNALQLAKNAVEESGEG